MAKVRWQQTDFHHTGASAPGSPTTGMTWFDTSLNQLKVYNGSSWIDHAGPSGPCGPFGADGSCGPMGSCGPSGIPGGPTGSCGPMGSCGPSGIPGGPTGACGLQGDLGACGTKGAEGDLGPDGQKGELGPCGLMGSCGLSGLEGSCGLQGIHGGSSATYQFSATPDTSIDPGTGFFRLDSGGGSQAFSTEIAIHKYDSIAADLQLWLLSWDDGFNPIYHGQLRFTDNADTSNYLLFDIASDVTTQGGGDWYQVTLNPSGNSSANPFSTGDYIHISHQPRGWAGSCGIKGELGPCGTKGATGACGIKGELGPCGTKGVKGELGSCGIQGINAGDYQLYKFADNTTMADPGSGYFRLKQDVDQFQSLEMSINKFNLSGDSVNLWIAGWDDSSRTIRVSKRYDHEAFVVYRINSGSITNNTGWFTVVLDPEDASTGDPFSDNDEIFINLIIHGDAGPCGPQGAKGEIGACGLKGEFGACGTKGVTGDIGACGTKGVTGDIGACGIKGDTGACGTKGELGQCGPRGSISGLKLTCGGVGTTPPVAKWMSDDADPSVASTFYFRPDSTATGYGYSWITSWLDNAGGTFSINPSSAVGFDPDRSSYEISTVSGDPATGIVTVVGNPLITSATNFSNGELDDIYFVEKGYDGSCGVKGADSVWSGSCGVSYPRLPFTFKIDTTDTHPPALNPSYVSFQDQASWGATPSPTCSAMSVSCTDANGYYLHRTMTQWGSLTDPEGNALDESNIEGYLEIIHLLSGYVYYFRVITSIAVGVGQPDYRILGVKYIGSTDTPPQYAWGDSDEVRISFRASDTESDGVTIKSRKPFLVNKDLGSGLYSSPATLTVDTDGVCGPTRSSSIALQLAGANRANLRADDQGSLHINCANVGDPAGKDIVSVNYDTVGLHRMVNYTGISIIDSQGIGMPITLDMSTWGPLIYWAGTSTTSVSVISNIPAKSGSIFLFINTSNLFNITFDGSYMFTSNGAALTLEPGGSMHVITAGSSKLRVIASMRGTS